MKYLDNFKECYQNGFKSSVKTLLLYIIISSIWIIVSDAVVSMMFIDSKKLEQAQNFKGLLFVVFTTLLLSVLLWRNYKAIMSYKNAYNESVLRIKEIESAASVKNPLYDFMTEHIVNNEADTDEVLIEAFRIIFSQIKSCDLGSVFKVINNRVIFLDAVGFNLDKLNSINMSGKNFTSHPFSLNKDKLAEKNIKKNLGSEKYAEYGIYNPKIQESLHVGLVKTDNIYMGIALDISQESWIENKHSFSKQEIVELNEFQVLGSALFRMREMVGVKKLLQKDIVNSLVATLEHHDTYTKGHSEFVAKIANVLGKYLKLNHNELQELWWAAIVHDIGKIVVPTKILNKNGKLTDEEFDVIKKHPCVGEDFLSKSESLIEIAKDVRHHHERWDGMGYPDGLKEKEIPYFSRIICVADSYHAMTSDRPYRKGLDKDSAHDEIINCSGKQFCPIIVEAFVNCREEIELIN